MFTKTKDGKYRRDPCAVEQGKMCEYCTDCGMVCINLDNIKKTTQEYNEINKIYPPWELVK